MDFLTFGILTNLTGLLLPLIFSLVIAHTYKRAYFSHWTASFAFFLVSIAAMLLPGVRPTWLSVLMLTGYMGGGWALLQTGAQWRGAAGERRAHGIAFATLWGLALATLLVTGSLEVALTPAVVFVVGAHLWLAWKLAREPRGCKVPSQNQLAGFIAVTGWFILAFPFLVDTPWLWLGYFISGSLHLLVGVWMVVFLLQEVAAHLARQNRALQELDAMKSGFIQTVSHELRTPATVLKTGLWLLQTQGDRLGEAEQRSLVSDMVLSSERLTALLGNVLDCVRVEAGPLPLHVAPFEAGELVATAVRELMPLAVQQGVKLEAVSPPDLVLEADPARLRQLLANLVVNALKFTPVGGAVTVRALSLPDGVRFEVEDTGVGIASEDQARVFERFRQLDPARARLQGGAGLGLYISKAIVEAHGGRIGLDSLSIREQGCLVWAELPAGGPAQPAVMAAAQASAKPALA